MYSHHEYCNKLDPIINLGKHYVACAAIRSNFNPQVTSKFTIWDMRLSHAVPVHPTVTNRFAALKLLSTGQLVGVTVKHTLSLLTFPAHQVQLVTKNAATVKPVNLRFFQPAIMPAVANAPIPPVVLEKPRTLGLRP